MEAITLPRPTSAGLFLTYRCTNTCKHCMYACSPRWPADWISEQDAERILAHLAPGIRDALLHPGRFPDQGRIGVNDGLHFTGGEPFLNFDLLLRLTRMARELGIPSLFVETNGFWCNDDATARDRLRALRDAGLDGLFVSANPFILEQIPFERTQRAVRLSHEVFPGNTIVYQPFFYRQFKDLGLTGTLRLDEYLERAGYGLQYVELFANGRVPYALGHLFQHRAAGHFFGTSCRGELLRDWHIHVDNQGHYLPGFCGGLSLGDGRHLDTLRLDLDRLPVIRALLTDLADLYRLGLAYGYRAPEDGYVSKCHLCADVRRHLARHGEFPELQPGQFYERLEDEIP
jgi:hypothetical protein